MERTLAGWPRASNDTFLSWFSLNQERLGRAPPRVAMSESTEGLRPGGANVLASRSCFSVPFLPLAHWESDALALLDHINRFQIFGFAERRRMVRRVSGGFEYQELSTGPR